MRVEVGEESCVQLQECKLPHLEDGLLIILFHLLLYTSLGILRARTMHYSNLPLTLVQKRRQRHQLWYTCQSSLCSFEVRFMLNVMGMSHFKI